MKLQDAAVVYHAPFGQPGLMPGFSLNNTKTCSLLCSFLSSTVQPVQSKGMEAISLACVSCRGKNRLYWQAVHVSARKFCRSPEFMGDVLA